MPDHLGSSLMTDSIIDCYQLAFKTKGMHASGGLDPFKGPFA